MIKHIKYKRFTKDFSNDSEIQEFFDELIAEGWDIIYYQETPKTVTVLNIVVVAGKKQPNTL